jgi:ribosome-interacting GTPase 1
VDQVADLRRLLRDRRVHLTPDWPAGPAAGEGEVQEDPFAILLPTLMLAAKSDLIQEIEAEIDVFREITGLDYPALPVSVETGDGLEEIGPWLFRGLDIVRVYTKAPGRPPDQDRPFTLRRGGTVADVARLVHKDIAESLRYARRWSKGDDRHVFQVGRDHPVEDGDLLELHV